MSMLWRPVSVVIEWRGGIAVKECVEKIQQEMVAWKQEELKKTLCGEPVLEISLSWPELNCKGLRGVNRYYCRMKDAWKRQWEREVYLSACVELAEKRGQSRPFTPWKVSLRGRVTLEDEALLSIVMEAREVHGNGRPLICMWGDTWGIKDGMPVALKELFPKKRGWKKQLAGEITAELERCGERGIRLDEAAPGTWKKCLSPRRFAVAKDKILLYIPQCSIAPTSEGVIELAVPRPDA